MKKIKVLRLSGCDWCKALVNKLNELNVSFEELDANKNEALADVLEAYLNTTYYPIVILTSEQKTIYLYRPLDTKDVGHTTLDQNIEKIGCLTAEAMLTQILNN